MKAICSVCEWTYDGELSGYFFLNTTPDCPNCGGFMEGFRIKCFMNTNAANVNLY